MSNPTSFDFLASSRVQDNGVPVIDLTLPGYEGESFTTTILETEALWLAAQLTHLVYERQRAAETSAEDTDVPDLDAEDDDQ